MKNTVRILITLIIICITMAPGISNAGSEPLVTLDGSRVPKETSEDRQVKLLLERAEDYYQQSLYSLDEVDIFKSIETLEELINRYPDSVHTPNTYFLIADLLSKKIQGKDGNNGAILAYQDYMSRFSFYGNAWQAQYNIASIQYLYLKDYKAAMESIEKLFEDFVIALEQNDDDMIQAKLLLAKILHKNGQPGDGMKALDEVEVLDYKMDFSYTGRLIQGIKSNRILKDGIDSFIFMGTFDKDFPVKLLVNKFRIAEQALTKRLPGITRDFPLEIFIYTDSEYFKSTTDREGSFGSGADAQIFHIVDHPIEPLFAQIYAFILNSQPSDLRVNFLETGFINAFGDVDANIDTAALELGISGDYIDGEIFFDNAKFTLVSEGVPIAAAYVNYLLDNYPPEYFYRVFKMLEGSKSSAIKLAGAEGGGFKMEGGWVRPQTLLDGLGKIYGLAFDGITVNFLVEMKARREQLDEDLDRYWAINPPEKFKIDQSSPEEALISYFKSIQSGRYEDLRKCTSGKLREILDEALSFYKKEKILDKVERWKMAIPYMGVKIEVVNREVFSDTIVVFDVNLLKEGKIMEKRNLVAVKEKSKWYITEN